LSSSINSVTMISQMSASRAGDIGGEGC
jgi:hypothetical protein